jgi:Ca2+-binding EF-hand superfamily protein
LGPRHLQSVLTSSLVPGKKAQDKLDNEIQNEKISVLINLYDTQKQGTISLGDFVQ